MYDLSGVTAEISLAIEAPPARIWDLLADLTLTPRINRETIRMEWVAPSTDWSANAIFRATNRIGDREWTVQCHVTVADRPRALEWSVLGPDDPSSMWSYRLESLPSGGTLVRHSFRHGPNVSGLRLAVEREPDRAEEIIAGRVAMLTNNMAHTLDCVATMATT